jgi:sugar lactone lactonase YvrE
VIPKTVRMRIWLGVGAVTVAAFAATALGGSGGGTITTVAGSGLQGFSGDGGPATSAKLNEPDGVAVDGKGNIYIADLRNGRVRKVSPGGTISTFAGTGVWGYSGDGGPATSAQLYAPQGVAVDGQGNVYIADRNNYRVRKVSAGGTITTFAGTGKCLGGTCFSGDGGPATSAQLYSPSGVAVDGNGNLYIADRDNSRVRKVSGGTITTIAGTSTKGFSGDGGPATKAQLFYPDAVAVDGIGNVYIADTFNNRVRKVSRGGTISTFAGTGACGRPVDGGPATSATVCNPRGVAVDGQGNVYIGDTNNSRVRKVSPGGTITTFAGTGTCGNVVGNGGPATLAQLCTPWGVAVDRQGNLYIAEEGRSRVRKVTVGTQASALTLTLGGASAQPLLAQQGVTVTAKCDKPCSLAATGSVTILGTQSVFVLSRASAKLASGTRTLTLRCSAAEQKRFRKLLKPGQHARAVITVKAKDKAGNTSTSKRTVAVRR